MRLRNMDQAINGQDTPAQEGLPENVGVKTTSSPAPENDPEVRIKALQEEVSKLTRDRNNYRDATLALKGKKDISEIDMSDAAQVAALIEDKVEEKLLSTRESKAQQERDEYAVELARKVKEMSLALQSKQAATSIGGGAASGAGFNPSSEAKTSYFSPEQVSALHKRWKGEGIPEAKWEGMLKRFEQLSKENA